MGNEADKNAMSAPDVNQSISEREDDRYSLSSEDTQTGVKNIEAISQTWTRWSLITAYLG